MGTQEFEAGTYYIGDLCYINHELGLSWDDICDHIDELVFNIGDTKLGWMGTQYGDGTYFDQEGRKYSVDSGTIGCVKVSNLIDATGG